MTLLVCALLGSGALLGVQTVSPVLPAVRAALDRMHPGWRIAAVTDDVRQTVGARLGPTPNVVAGDFDGNGRPDVAILVEYRNVDEPAESFTHYMEIIAFLDTGRGFEQVRVHGRQSGPNPEQYLTLQKRGEQGFDFKANQRFVYTHDSIGAWHFEKAGGTYVYDKGRFRFVIESD